MGYGVRLGLSCLVLLCSAPLAYAGGAVTYQKKDLPKFDFQPAGGLELKEGEKLKVAVMPLSVQATDKTIKAAIQGLDYKKKVWDMLKEGVRSSPHLDLVGLPKGAEEDEIIQKTLKYAAGLMDVSEFKKLEKFKVPDRFLYGAVFLNLMREQRASGPDKITYQAEAFLRLVNGTNMTYIARIAEGKAATVDGAIQSAVSQALQAYKPKKKDEETKKPSKEEKKPKPRPKRKWDDEDD